MDSFALLGLFSASFLAATLLPAQSEAILAAMVIADGFSPLALLLAASTGNVLGSCVNWVLGLQVDRLGKRRWFPVSEAKMKQVRETYARWGWPSLLLSWAPIIGDPLTLVAGAMKEPFWRFLLVVTFAKTARYVVIIAFAREFA